VQLSGYSVLHASVADELAIVGMLLGYASPPVLIYLLSAGVMDAHRVLVNDRIVAAREAARLAAAAGEGGEGESVPIAVAVAPAKDAQ
jgi:hypothetical protein